MDRNQWSLHPSLRLVHGSVILAFLLLLAGCSYRGPVAIIAPRGHVDSAATSGGIVAKGPSVFASASWYPVELVLPFGEVKPTGQAFREVSVGVYTAQGVLLREFDIGPLHVPRIEPPDSGPDTHLRLLFPLRREMFTGSVAHDVETSFTAVLSINIQDHEAIWLRLGGAVVCHRWAPRPETSSHARPLGLLLYPIYGLWRDILDAPFTALNQFGIGTDYPDEEGRRRIGRRWYLLPVLIPADILLTAVGMSEGVGASLIYGYTIIPVQTALFRSGVDTRFTKWQPMHVELVDGVWDETAMLEASRLERSLTFFPNWKLLAHRRAHSAPRKPGQTFLIMKHLDIHRIPAPAPDELPTGARNGVPATNSSRLKTTASDRSRSLNTNWSDRSP